MTSTEPMREHRTNCAAHLMRLRMLAAEQAGVPLPPGAVAEVAHATSAVVAEVKAAQHAALTIAAGGRRRPGNQRLLDARLDRLAAAARDAVVAARKGDPATLRERVRRFDALTSAMWTVQYAVCAPHRPARPRRAVSR